VREPPEGWGWVRSLKYATRVVMSTTGVGLCDAEWLGNYAMYRTWKAHQQHDFTPQRWRGCLRVTAQRTALNATRETGMSKRGSVQHEAPPPEIHSLDKAAFVTVDQHDGAERADMLALLPEAHRRAALMAESGHPSRAMGKAMGCSHVTCIKLLRESGEILKAAGYGTGRASA
jgi:hypothetical protein